MPSVRGRVGGEVGWCACPGGCCLLHPCCRSRCLPAGLWAALGICGLPVSGRQVGPGCPGGCERKHRERQAESGVQV